MPTKLGTRRGSVAHQLSKTSTGFVAACVQRIRGPDSCHAIHNLADGQAEPKDMRGTIEVDEVPQLELNENNGNLAKSHLERAESVKDPFSSL